MGNEQNSPPFGCPSESSMAEQLRLANEELALFISKYEREEFQVSKDNALKEEKEYHKLVDEIVEKTLNFHQKVRLSDPTAIFAEKSRNKELIELELEQKNLICEIAVLKENDNLELLQAEEKSLLEEISFLKSKRSQIEPVPEGFTSDEYIEKEIELKKAELQKVKEDLTALRGVYREEVRKRKVWSTAGGQSSQNRTYRKSQSFERAHSTGRLEKPQVQEGTWKTYSRQANVFQAGQKFANKQEEKEVRSYSRVDSHRPHASGGGILSTPRTFTRNPAPPTPELVTSSGIPLFKLGGFLNVNQDESSDDEGEESESFTRKEEADEDVPLERSSGKGPSRPVQSLSATQHHVSSEAGKGNIERSANQFMGHHHSSLGKEYTIMKRTVVVCKETEIPPNKYPKFDKNA